MSKGSAEKVRTMEDEVSDRLPEWVRILRQAVLESEDRRGDEDDRENRLG